MAGDAARRKNQRGFLIVGQRGGPMPALKSQRATGNFHARTEAPRAPFTKRGEERVLSKALTESLCFRIGRVHGWLDFPQVNIGRFHYTHGPAGRMHKFLGLFAALRERTRLRRSLSTFVFIFEDRLRRKRVRSR